MTALDHAAICTLLQECIPRLGRTLTVTHFASCVVINGNKCTTAQQAIAALATTTYNHGTSLRGW